MFLTARQNEDGCYEVGDKEDRKREDVSMQADQRTGSLELTGGIQTFEIFLR